MEKNAIYKNKWFWIGFVIIAIIIISISISINIKKEKEEEEKIKKAFSGMVDSTGEYYREIQNSESHIDDFSYNYETEQVEYRPKITLEKYNAIKEGMTEKAIINILGNEDKRENGENTYMLTWGNSYAPVYGGYWIQIAFDKNGKVLNKYQTGL